MNESPFELGRSYTRREIYDILGGDLVSNFPSQQGQVLYCCVSQYWNPDAPEIILIERQEGITHKAKHFISQSEPVPVFLRQGTHKTSKLVYRGMFLAERYSTDRDEIQLFARKAYRSGVAAVLFLRQVST